MPHKDPEAKRAYFKEYRTKNKAYLSALNRSWVVKNKERVFQNKRRWYLENQERLVKEAHDHYHRTKVLKPKKPTLPPEHFIEYDRAYMKKRYWSNPEKHRAASKQYRLQKPEQHKAATKRWRELNKERFSEMQRQWRKNNPHKNKHYKSLRRVALGNTIDPLAIENYYAAIRRAVIVSCVYCGKLMSGRFAHIDHIVPVSRGGLHAVENLCVSCQSCNSKKSNKLISEWRPELDGILKGGLI